MDQLDAMQIYVRVAELASFTQAAESMGLPKATISAAVRQLENQLGARLLHRTTRKVQVTQDGQTFFERCKDLLADMEELQTLFQTGQAELTGRLRVDMSVGVARNIVLPRLPEFLKAHPKLEIEISGTDRRVDLVREGFDCVLRVGTLADSSLVARPLGALKLISCASRCYLDAHGTPRSIDDLAGHRLVHYVSSFGARSPGFEYRDEQGTTRFVDMAGGVTVNNSDAYQAACLAGLGIIQVPDIGIATHLAGGALVEILPEWRPAPMPVSLLYANRRHLPRRVQAFMAWVAELVRPHLLPVEAS